MAYADWLKSFKNIREHPRPIKLAPKSGTVPNAIRGTLYKCGPGEVMRFGTPVAHPFDGDGFVSALRFEDGEVSYQARMVQTKHRTLEEASGQRLFSGAFGTPPIFRMLKNPANTNVLEWGRPGNKKLLVFCESGATYMLDPETLETVGSLASFQDGIPMETSIPWMNTWLREHKIFGDAICAHPKVDTGANAGVGGVGANGDLLIFYTLTYRSGSTVITFYEMNRDFEIVHTTPYMLKGFLYLHDFVVTPTHYVFFHHPLAFETQNLHLGAVNCLRSSHPAINVLCAVPRPSNPAPSDYQIEALPGFVTHHARISWSESDPSKIDLLSIMYEDVFNFQNMQAMSEGSLYQSQWDMKEGALTQRKLFHRWMEFPAAHPNGNVFATMSQRYHRNVQQCLVRANEKRYELWDAGVGMFVGEPVVDDTGHVFALMYDSTSDTSSLGIFDQARISQGPIAEVWLPEAVPCGLHGSWSPDA